MGGKVEGSPKLDQEKKNRPNYYRASFYISFWNSTFNPKWATTFTAC